MDFLEVELRNNDREQYAGRLARFREIDAWLPNWEAGLPFEKHVETMRAFQDARFAYVDGYWIAAILSALAALERHLVWRVVAAGHKKAAHLELQKVIVTARDLGFISTAQAGEFDRLRESRNDFAHYRKDSKYWETFFSMADKSGEADKDEDGFDVNMVFRDDAKAAIILASSYFGGPPTPT